MKTEDSAQADDSSSEDEPQEESKASIMMTIVGTTNVNFSG